LVNHTSFQFNGTFVETLFTSAIISSFYDMFSRKHPID
jgi:hypothetical protein